MKSLFLAIILFSSLGFSKTLIISDIDDTIKASHVRDKTDTIQNALVTTIAFKGMKEAYLEVLNNPDTEIVYVTNALEWMMKKSHSDFIKKNFPQGKIYFRNGSSDTHKYNTIKKILDQDPTIDRLILVGDNGERDITFYNQIREEYQESIDIYTYIRILYVQPEEDVLPLEEGQKGFVSPLELLSDFTVNGLVPLERYFETAEKLSSEIINAKKEDTDQPHYFPKWLNCSGFDPGYYPGLFTPNIEEGFAKVRDICQ